MINTNANQNNIFNVPHAYCLIFSKRIGNAKINKYNINVAANKS